MEIQVTAKNGEKVSISLDEFYRTIIEVKKIHGEQEVLILQPYNREDKVIEEMDAVIIMFAKDPRMIENYKIQMVPAK